MSNPLQAISLAVVITAGAFLAQPLDAAPEAASLEAWIPGDVVAVARIDGLGNRLTTLLDSQFRRDLEATRLAQMLRASGKLSKLTDGLDRFQRASGRDALSVLDDLFGREVVIGARMTFIGIPEVIILSRTRSEASLTEARRAIERAVEDRAGHKIETGKSEYRDRQIETVGEGHFAYFGDVLALSNSKGMIESAIDLVDGREKSSVASSDVFASVASQAGERSFIRLAVRPRFLPGFKIPAKADNPLASLLFGGFFGALRASDVIGAAVDVEKDGLALRLVTVPDDRGLEDRYDAFFPRVLSSDVEKRLRARGVLGFIAVQRDLVKWWERAGELLEARASGDLTEFAGNMSLFFGGKSFQDEVLPELGETITLVARNQTYPEAGRKPTPTIPGIAAIFELRNAGAFGRSFKVAFNTIVGIINVDRMQKKKDAPTMLVAPRLVGGTECYTVDMGLPPSADEVPGIEYNFTPSLALVGDRVVLSSSFELLSVLVEELEGVTKRAPATTTATAVAGKDRVLIDGASALAIATDNRDFFASKNMVEKGISLDAARAEIDAILEVGALLRDLDLRSFRKGDELHLDLRLRLARGAEGSKTKTAALED